jgi:hypothetical protein
VQSLKKPMHKYNESSIAYNEIPNQSIQTNSSEKNLKLLNTEIKNYLTFNAPVPKFGNPNG